MVTEKVRSNRAGRGKPGARRRPVGMPKPKVPRRRHSPFEEEWEAFKDEVLSNIRASANSVRGAKIAPFHRTDSILKRMVYRFVIKYRHTNSYKHIEKAISDDRDSGRALRISFEENPFHWILFGLKDHVSILGKFEITKTDITRFSAQLLYADRHKICEDLLIGFLLQSGTLTEVCRKAKDPDCREDWYIAKIKAGEGSQP